MKQTRSTLDNFKVLRYCDIRDAGIVRNRTTLSRWMSRPENPFPQPIRLGENSIVWKLRDIEAWLDRQAAGNGTAA
jgi:hypothetical protein